MFNDNFDGIFGFDTFTVTSASDADQPQNAKSINRPKNVFVSARYPGSKFFEVSLSGGANDDEAMSAMLLQAGVSLLEGDAGMTRLQLLRELLLDGKLLTNTLAALLPRGNVTLQRGVYQLAEESATAMVTAAAEPFSSDLIVTSVYTKMMVRALHSMGFISQTRPEYFAQTDRTFVVDLEQMRQLFVIERLKPILSGAVISAKLRDVDLGKKNAAAVIASRLADALATLGTALTQVVASLREFDTAVHVVRLSYVAPETLPVTIVDSAEVLTLRDIANFTVLALTTDVQPSTMSEFEYGTALRNVTRGLTQTAALSLITLDAYKQFFIGTPIVNSLGVVSGAVWALPLAQQAQLAVVQARTESEVITQIDLLPSSMTPAPVLAKIVSDRLTSVNTTLSLVHQIADTVSGSSSIDAGSDAYVAVLATLGVAEVDRVMLAIARSSQLLLGELGFSGVMRLIYGITSAEAIGVRADSAIGAHLYYANPNQVLVYSAQRETEPHVAMAQRTNGLPKSVTQLARFVKFEGRVNREVQKTFGVSIETEVLDSVTREVITLPLRLDISLTGSMPDLTTSRSAIAVVTEPAVAAEADRNMLLMLALAKSEDKATSYRAISAFAAQLVAAADEPALAALAEYFLRRAVRESNYDLRALASTVQRMYFRAITFTYLAALVRLGVLSAATTSKLAAELPFDELELVTLNSIRLPRGLSMA